jgi:hypothetical protein
MSEGESRDVALLFQRRKLKILLGIMGVGMMLAVETAAWEAWVLHSIYPYSTFLFYPRDRFSDYSDNVFTACLSNPYNDSGAFYLPTTWALFRLISPLSCAVSLIGFLFICLGGSILLLTLVLRKIVPQPGTRLLVAFALVALSYPVLMCVDRGNLEILLALLVGATLYFFYQARHLPAAACLTFAISLKLYPVLLLTLFFRQRKIGYVVMMAGLIALLTAGAMAVLSLSYSESLHLYSQNMTYFIQRNVYENYNLEGSASLWNSYKYVVLKLADWRFIGPVDFRFDDPFIQHSYSVYNAFMVAVALLLVAHVTLVEREVTRCAILLLLYMGIAVPSGADYRLLYVGVAVALHLAGKSQRKYDLFIMVLLALTMVPKKEIFLPYAGHLHGWGSQVPLQVMLNAPCVALAIVLMAGDGWAFFDAKWSRLRAGQLLRSLRPSRLWVV